MDKNAGATRGVSRKQARAIEILLNDPRKSKARAIREAGYGQSVARQPHKVFGSSAVIKELEKRGYDELGIRIIPQSFSTNEPALPQPLTIDFTKIPLEQIQDLKEKLRALDIPRNEEKHFYVPTEEGVDILNGSLVQPKKLNDMSSFSAM